MKAFFICLFFGLIQYKKKKGGKTRKNKCGGEAAWLSLSLCCTNSSQTVGYSVEYTQERWSLLRFLCIKNGTQRKRDFLKFHSKCLNMFLGDPTEHLKVFLAQRITDEILQKCNLLLSILTPKMWSLFSGNVIELIQQNLTILKCQSSNLILNTFFMELLAAHWQNPDILWACSFKIILTVLTQRNSKK